MTYTFTITAAAALAVIAGCDTTTTGAVSGTPGLAEQGCLRDVKLITNNQNARLIGSDASRAGNVVTIAVGETGRWQCIGFDDGTTADITSVTDEGRL